ncbi:hypothetical protein [Lentzea flava]|uniref:Uncharacterized protein n=1 Tax=Lentzea flava TaxID=103732 RepID=A0ABQ2VCP6_9PSEU|nr:hypothetical protein [Lentzea flava]MCP2204377.1 hypothetical protein [Lentzea flava]GGU77147.1 hypothetical protein GCM10010178_80480 [Lentzea flava]
MTPARRGGCGCAVPLLGLFLLFFGLPLTMLLVAPAIAAHIVAGASQAQAVYLQEWLWASTGSLPLALVLVRSVLNRNGRLRRQRLVKRWPGMLARALALLGVMNATAFLTLNPGEHVIEDGMGPLLGAAAAGIGALIAVSLWDRRPRRVTLGEVRTAAAEADRVLRRVRAQNDRVRRQADQVQARLVQLRTRPPGRPDVEFHALRTFHRESYQCADTAHLAYQSAQTSMRTMSQLVRRARFAPHRLGLPGRARAEMHAAATHLAQSHLELRAQVDQGLGMVRTLNANTSELKFEIRDSCGPQGEEWFEALELRIEKAREERAGGLR